MNHLIYKSKHIWVNPISMLLIILTLIQVVMIVILLTIVIKNYFVTTLMISGVLYGIFRFLKSEFIFKLYEDRIDFVNNFREEKIIRSISLAEITQVRYEDSFSNESPFISLGYNSKIYLYLDNKDKKTNNSPHKIIINIRESKKNREQILINILKVFKTRKIELFVSTKYKRLLNELEIKNWTDL